LKQFSIIAASLLGLFIALTTAHAAENASSQKNSFIESDEEAFLSPDQAFKLNIRAIDETTLNAEFTIASGHYLYKDKIKFESSNNKISEVVLPKGDIKQDSHFGQTEVFHQSFSALIKLSNPISQGDPVAITATYQGCSEKGLCYSPIRKNIDVDVNVNKANEAKHDDQATTLLKGGKIWLIIAGFFGFGLLLALTPCVLPMIPILSGIIVGDKKVHHHATSRLHAFNLSLAYTLGMALSYTLAGIAAGLSGQLLSNALQNPWVLSGTALIFVALAMSMFGLYELRLPSRIETRMANMANSIKGGQWLGVFSMGALSALIVSPCVAAPLAGALIYISQTRDVLLGGVALFSLSIGMGVPLLLIGASAGHVLPKAGPWMTAVRNFFGVLMLAVAVWIVLPIVPKAFTTTNNAAHSVLPFKQIRNIPELDKAIKAARHKTVMVDFYADWCVACKELERFTFSDPKIQAALKDVVLLQVDVTDNSQDQLALLNRFKLFGPPGMAFFNKSGQEVAPLKTIGYQDAETLLKTIEKLNQLKENECNPTVAC
jgi:thiol:disulfide interchange protein DsbD